MKLFCQRGELNCALNNVSHAIPSRTTSKILEGILAEVKGDRLYLTATDTNMTIETSIGVRSDIDFSVVIPAKIFMSIISKLPEDDMSIEFDEVKCKLKIKSGNFKSELMCFASDEFPKIKTEAKEKSIIVEKDVIKKLIRKTSFSASTDEVNGILTGILVELGEGVMRMVAVDTFRMALYSSKVKDDSEEKIVIPAKMMNDLAKVISDDAETDSNVCISIVDNKAVFTFDNNRVTVNTLNGKYIDYSRIIKNDGEIELRVSRDEIVKAIDRASILSSSQNNNLIKMTITDDCIQINSLSDEGNIEEKVEIIKTGNDIIIGFNSRYLMDALRASEDDEVKLYMKDSVSPCIVKPVSGDDYLYLILPVRIN